MNIYNVGAPTFVTISTSCWNQELFGFARNSEAMEIREITAAPARIGIPITRMAAAQRIALPTNRATSCPRRTTMPFCDTGEPLSRGLPGQPSFLIRCGRRIYYRWSGMAQRSQRAQSSRRRETCGGIPRGSLLRRASGMTALEEGKSRRARGLSLRYMREKKSGKSARSPRRAAATKERAGGCCFGNARRDSFALLRRFPL
jgi:hypothetical protein